MAQHNELGRIGEDEACFLLMHLGYNFIERNWQKGHLEIDIVAEYLGELVFVEVKTRADEHVMNASDAVSLTKRMRIIAAARTYMAEHNIYQPYRFDVITVVGHERPFRIRHYINAFTDEC